MEESLKVKQELIQSKITPRVIKYITFANSEEFEKWQTETGLKVIQISPIITQANSNQHNETKPNEFDLKLNISVFVTYYE